LPDLPIGWALRSICAPVLENFADELGRMIEAGHSRAWLRFGKMDVYIRVGKKVIGGKLTDCVQLANLNTPARHQRKGTFDRFLIEIRTVTKMPIYVEQILNREFFDALLRRGFTPAREYEGVIWDLMLIGET
jgi:hypothetical protein